MWLGPPMQHMLDSRSDPFSLDEWDDFMTIRAAGPGWQRALARWNVTDVLCSDEVPLCHEMSRLPNFVALERSPDAHVRVFERRT
jgi:hypothetical protein